MTHPGLHKSYCDTNLCSAFIIFLHRRSYKKQNEACLLSKKPSGCLLWWEFIPFVGGVKAAEGRYCVSIFSYSPSRGFVSVPVHGFNAVIIGSIPLVTRFLCAAAEY